MSSAKNASGPYELRCQMEEASKTKSYRKRFGHFIRINRKEYELVFCKDLSYEGKEVAGLCASDERKIYINTSAEPIEETLLHEIWHAEVAEAGLRQMTNWSEDLEELTAELIGKAVSHNYKLTKR